MIVMPQIRCPTCGTLINLESRRDNDYKMILKALKNNGRTFSELLKITRLPRKTLSLRLKQLINHEEIVKNGKYYAHNGKGKTTDSLLDRELHFLSNKKLLASLIIIVLSIPSFSLAFALIYRSAEPEPLGYFRVVISVNNVTDVYAWQVAIRFNHTNLKMQNIKPGNFLAGTANTRFEKFENIDNIEISDKTFFVYKLDKGTILAGETLLGDIPEANGNGTLLIIEFAYFYSYEEGITIIFDESSQYNFSTVLLRKDGTEIPINQNTISLHFEKFQ